MEQTETLTLLLLAGVGLAAGFIDAIAGGGGLVSVPALLALGAPPQLALGTSKMQATCGSLTAALSYARKGLIDLRSSSRGVLFTILGAAAGAFALRHASTAFLEKAVPCILVAVFVF